MYIKKSIIISNKKLELETGKIARNAKSSIFANIDGTTLLVTVVYEKSENKDFLQLKVDYFEKYYANGKIPSNYFRREGRPSEREILISRLIDRSIRPTIPKNIHYEIQVVIIVLSINPEINPDIIAINAASAALSISGLPFKSFAAIRVCYKNNNFYINPTKKELNNSSLKMIISGTLEEILMIESSSFEMSEDLHLDIINFGYNNLKKLLKFIKYFEKTVNKNKVNYKYENNFFDIINNEYYSNIENIYQIKDIQEKEYTLKKIIDNIIFKYSNYNINKKYIKSIINKIEKDILRKKILITKKRLDNRTFNQIRKINIINNILKNVHGSSLFSRGNTQALVCVTLGSDKDAQMIDCTFENNKRNNFILHYNFHPFSVNEIGNINSIKRREIGHGNLAKKSLIPVLPDKVDFPYVIRIVSEIFESNGSSSMATICGSSLALMSGGIPIKKHVCGLAMGLIKNKKKYAILTDISGEEDHIGDMDFKIAGTKNGITALQMDVKTLGIDFKIIKEIINEAKNGKIYIINLMDKEISSPMNSLNPNAPKIKKLKIDRNKIKNLIGKGGVTVKYLTKKYDCKIDINNDGNILLSYMCNKNVNDLIQEIKNMTMNITVGYNFKGKVIKLVQFGAFVNIFLNKDGLLHISKINKYKLNHPNWEIKEGLIIDVVVLNIDSNDKISLNLV